MSPQPGDLVIAYFWKKPRPMLVLELNEDGETCHLTPFTTVKESYRKQRRQLRRGETLRVEASGEFQPSTRASYLKLCCTHPEYKIADIGKMIGPLDAGQWVTIMMYHHLYNQRKGESHGEQRTAG